MIERARAVLAGLDPLALEGCVRVPAAPAELVAGFDATERGRLAAIVELVAPAHAARVARWLDALPDTTDLGCKVASGAGDLQIYARGDYEPAQLAAAFRAADVACAPVVVRNGLALFDRTFASMAGLELHGAAAGGAVYAGLARTRAVAQAFTDAFGFLALALVPAAAPAWAAIAPTLLDAPGEEIAYVSFAPVEREGWIKLDVSERPLPVARRVIEAAGLAADWPALRATLEGTPIERWSHVGVRLASSGGVAVVLYHAVT